MSATAHGSDKNFVRLMALTPGQRRAQFRVVDGVSGKTLRHTLEDRLMAIRREAWIVCLAAEDVLSGTRLDASDHKRLQVAHLRLKDFLREL